MHLAAKFELTLSEHGIVGRMGGDEFIWLAESDDPMLIEQQYALLLDELKAPYVSGKEKLYIRISSGAVIAKDYDYNTTQLLELADEAMYQAKSRQMKDIYWASTELKKTTSTQQHPSQSSLNKQYE